MNGFEWYMLHHTSLYLIAKYLSDWWIILRIRPLRLSLGEISALITEFIIQELSDYPKFLKI